jgi:colanic acid/amylovoran biosynthesis glycosyltransferase
MKITYLINQYPKVSHTFIRREILALEKQGFEIQRIALRGWSDNVVDPQDVEEKSKTKFVLNAGAAGLLGATLKVLITKPVLFFKTLILACRLGMKADRSLPYHLIYFLESCRTYLWATEFESQHMHAHFGTNPSEILMLVNALSGIPYSFTVHGPEEFDRPVFLKLKEKIHAAKFVVAVSSFGRSQLQRWIPHDDWGKVKVVHCGLESNFYNLPTVKIPTKPQLVCVGRLCEQKGQLLLVEAAKVISDRGIDFSLVLAGDGEMRELIESLIKNYSLTGKVKITGWISSEQVREVMLSSQALVLPSFAEGLPVVIMEAMSLKRPVISTYIAGIPELVQSDSTGWLVPAGSLDHLVDAMIDLINSPIERLETMGELAHQRVIERHHIDIEVSKLASYIRAHHELSQEERA